MPIVFDAKSNRYRDDQGRFVSDAQVRGAINSAVNLLEKDLRQLARDYNSGKINLPEWQTQTADKIKTVHVLTAVIGKGGRSQMTSSDWGKIGAEIREQYKYLNNFAQLVEQGKISGIMLENRAARYAKAARDAYFENEKDLRAESGDNFCRRVLNATESCVECAEWAAKGFIPIDEQPEIGELLCGSFCKCEFEYLHSIN